MKFAFDTAFDHGSWPGPLANSAAAAGERWVGTLGLIGELETQLGLGGREISQAERVAAIYPTVANSAGFWQESAEVDPFGVAARLLDWRDTLRLHGWQGTDAGRLGELRLATSQAPPGIPDRVAAIITALGEQRIGLRTLHLGTPRDMLPRLLRDCLDALASAGVAIAPIPASPERLPDLELIRAPGPLVAADQIAAWLAAEGCDDTLIITPDAILDAALHRHGLPTTGASSDGSSQPLLQLIPLALQLCWEPVDPALAYELLMLPQSPVPRGLARKLRRALQEWPSVTSASWQKALEDVEDPAVLARVTTLFTPLAAPDQPLPADALLERLTMLRDWLQSRIATADESERKPWAIATARVSALDAILRRMNIASLSAELLRKVLDHSLANESLTPFPAEAGLAAVRSPGSLRGPVGTCIWWGFDRASAPQPTGIPLTEDERSALLADGAELPDPVAEFALRSSHWRRPLAHSNRLLLVCPHTGADGKPAYPHPLWDELLGQGQAGEPVSEPSSPKLTKAARPLRALPRPVRRWSLSQVPPKREVESPSGVRTMMGCSLQWLLRYVGKHYKQPVALGFEDRIAGSVVHELVSMLVDDKALTPDNAAAKAGALFDSEAPSMAAFLFMPGYELRRSHVRNTLCASARDIAQYLQEGDLVIMASEDEFYGTAFDTMFKGKPDLVVEDPDVTILDLKWGGLGYRESELREGTASQLTSYAFLVSDAFAKTAPNIGYYILQKQRLRVLNDPRFGHGTTSVFYVALRLLDEYQDNLTPEDEATELAAVSDTIDALKHLAEANEAH